jgi:mono/diheme cytochrome c family protein
MPFLGRGARHLFRRRSRAARASIPVLVSGSIALALSGPRISALQTAQTGLAPTRPAASAVERQAVLNQYCVTCHNQKLRTAGFALDRPDVADPSANAEVWEKVIAKL